MARKHPRATLVQNMAENNDNEKYTILVSLHECVVQPMYGNHSVFHWLQEYFVQPMYPNLSACISFLRAHNFVMQRLEAQQTVPTKWQGMLRTHSVHKRRSR